MGKRWYIIVLFTLVHTFALAQQDASYSQYIFNSVYINPAYAGYKERLNINAIYRNQWTGIEGSPKSMAFAVDAVVHDADMGLALQISTDQLGAQKNLSMFANYAYRLPMNEEKTSRLSFGLGIGFQQSGLFGDLLKPGDQGDISLPTGTIKELVPDFRTGIFFSNEQLYVGISADNLISQYILKKKALTIDFPTPKPHYYLTAGAIVPVVADQVDFKPSFLIKDDIAGPTVLDLNAFFLFKQKIWIGAGYRTGIKIYDKPNLQKDLNINNALIGMVEFYFNDYVRLGYSYDHSLSGLSGYSGSTHEVSLGIYFKTQRERRINFCYF